MIASNYNFALSMLYLAQNPASDVNADWRGALRSSNKVLSAFFDLVNHDRQYLTMWTPINTRAYAQTVCISHDPKMICDKHAYQQNQLMICKVLSTAREQTNETEDPWLQLAVGNHERYVDLLTHAQGSWAFELKKREYLDVLSGYRNVVSPAACL